MRRALAALLVAGALGCGGDDRAASAPTGGLRDVMVVMKDASEPLPFDPRGGRLTRVTQEVAELLGHPVVLELDAALSPELAASLGETVLASFEQLARELVALRRSEPAVFERARRLERVVCTYDALAKASTGALAEGGRALAVRAPPDRFPLLEPGVTTEAMLLAHVADLDARFGEADPATLAPGEQAAWFAYMTTTRPGSGYVWTSLRRERARTGAATFDASDTLRLEHLGRIVRLGERVEPRSPLGARVREHLLAEAELGAARTGPSARARRADPSVRARVSAAYDAWLGRALPAFDDADRLALARALWERVGRCDEGCDPLPFPSVDGFAFGLSVHDAWARDGAPVDLAKTPRGELFRAVVCPRNRPTREGELIQYGCSRFFEHALQDDAVRARLARTILTRGDARLLESALSNIGSREGAKAVQLVEALAANEALFHHGATVLFHDHARRDDVRDALDDAAPRWWRAFPAQRGFTLLVLARRWERTGAAYADDAATRFVAEYGGAVSRDVLAAFFAEGARAAELAPLAWKALPRGSERDEGVVTAMTALLDQDRATRSSRAPEALARVRARFCAERNGPGLALLRARLERWAAAHPDDAASVANAISDGALARCPRSD